MIKLLFSSMAQHQTLTFVVSDKGRVISVQMQKVFSSILKARQLFLNVFYSTKAESVWIKPLHVLDKGLVNAKSDLEPRSPIPPL